MNWKPTLDDMERVPDTSHRTGYQRMYPDNREPATRDRALGDWRCWCGERYGHPWPGRDAGVPHPRQAVSR